MFRLFRRDNNVSKEQKESLKFNNSYYIVFQNKTYFEEKAGGYLWAPQQYPLILHWTDIQSLKGQKLLKDILPLVKVDGGIKGICTRQEESWEII